MSGVAPSERVSTGALLLSLLLLAGGGDARGQDAAGRAAGTTTAPPRAPAAAAQPETTPVAPAELGPVRIEATLDRRTVTVGDPITLTVRLIHPADVKVVEFDPERSLGDLALVGRLSPEVTKLPDGRIGETRVLRVALYRLGEGRVPSFEATFADAGGKQGKVATPPVPFSVGSILASGDTRPADLKNPAVMREPPWWPWAVAAALAAIGALWLWLRRRKKPAPEAPVLPAAPPRPAHETAYEELGRLLAAGLLEKGRVKEFYIELVEILKRYVAARFGVETFERTSAEILETLRLVRLPVKGLTLAATLFEACDRVKFAKYLPDAGETRATVERGYQLIDETRPREEPAAGDPAAIPGTAAGGAR